MTSYTLVLRLYIVAMSDRCSRIFLAESQNLGAPAQDLPRISDVAVCWLNWIQLKMMTDQSGLWWWWCLVVSFAGLHRAIPSPCTPIFKVSQAEIDRSPWVVWWSILRWQDAEDACCCLRTVCLLITFCHCWLRNRDCWKRPAEDFSIYILKVYWSVSCLPSCLQSLLQNRIELNQILASHWSNLLRTNGDRRMWLFVWV